MSRAVSALSTYITSSYLTALALFTISRVLPVSAARSLPPLSTCLFDPPARRSAPAHTSSCPAAPCAIRNMTTDAMPTVLVTGGAGYIGSHTVLELVEAGYRAVVVDNLDNSSEESLERVKQLTGKADMIEFRKVDLLDEPALAAVFKEFSFYACVHFAGLKAVGESVREPLRYYHNNLTGTLHLLNLLAANDCKNFVFSSSATVYGTIKEMPVTEGVPIGATNPYGRTKLFIEEFLRDLHKADPTWNILILRYFNPVGAHPSGRIGEDPSGIPNNLMPYIAQVAVGRREHLSVFGTDYPTPDGTGVRDYIHVVDLAKGHAAALRKLSADPGCVSINLGTGKGFSVLDMLNGMSKACGRELPYKTAPRRDGDVAELYADPEFAAEFLGWRAELGVDAMCADTWRWQSQNPKGYKAAPVKVVGDGAAVTNGTCGTSA